MHFALLPSLLGALSALAKTTTVKVAGYDAVLSTAASRAAIQCGQGQSLTYSIKTSTLSGISLSKAQAYFSNWAQDAPSTNRISSSGSTGVGSTRAWNVTDGSLKSTSTIREKLTLVNAPSGNGANLEQQYQSTAAEYYNSGSLVFYAAYKDVTVGQNSNGVFIQYYMNVCANNQQAAYPVLATILQDALTFWINAIKNGNPVSSFQPPASSTVSLPPANPTQSNIACKQGQSLVYKISTQMDDGVTLAAAQAYFKNWVGTSPSTEVLSTSGNNGVGSTRRWTQTDSSLQSVAPISEVLTAVINPSSSSSNLRLQWQIKATQGYYNGKLQVYQAFNDLTIGQANGQPVFLQYFVNACANSADLANQALPTIINDALNFWNSNA